MVAVLSRQRLITRGLNLPLAPLAGGALAIFTALVFALMPVSFLENLAIDSGIAAVLPAAEPPLGFTARAVLVLLVGGGVGAISWFALFLVLGGRTIAITPGSRHPQGEPTVDGMPVLRRADAHPDAPPRRPLSANRDLGTPFLDVHALRRAGQEAPAAGPPPVQPLPDNLDLPLAAFDPAAMRDEPADWFPLPAPLPRTPRRQLYEVGERFETFLLPGTDVPGITPHSVSAAAPNVPPTAPPITPPRATDFDGSASIHALLDRLERGVAPRKVPAEPIRQPMPMSAPPPAPPPTPPARGDSLEDALTTLRRLATRG